MSYFTICSEPKKRNVICCTPPPDSTPTSLEMCQKPGKINKKQFREQGNTEIMNLAGPSGSALHCSAPWHLHLGDWLFTATTWAGSFGNAMWDSHLGRSCHVSGLSKGKQLFLYSWMCLSLDKWQVGPEDLAQTLNQGPGSAKARVVRRRLRQPGLEQ